MLLLLGIMFVFAGLLCGAADIFFSLRKKQNHVLPWVCLGLVTVGAALFSASMDSMSSALVTGGISALAVTLAAAVVLLIRRLRKKPCRVNGIVTLVCLACCVVLFVGGAHFGRVEWEQRKAEAEERAQTIRTEVGFEVKDGDQPLESQGYFAARSGNCYVQESGELYRIFGDLTATAADCQRALAENPDIAEEYRQYFVDFIDRMAKIYPDMDYRILYHNLKTLKVVVCSQAEFVTHSLSITASGCYVRTENTIYIPEGTEFVEGEWGFQVLIHEFCHAARSAYWTTEDGKTQCAKYSSSDSDADMIILEESMNSAFSCSLLNYFEEDIAYQLPSNYLRIMLECMDNFNLVDYINHSEAYFCQKLDEYSGYTNYAATIWQLIDLQREDALEEKIDIPAEAFYPIYDFLCELYYPKHITAEMSDEEAKAVVDDLVARVFFDVPEEYKITPERFYEDLDTYRAAMSADALHNAA